MDRSSRLHDAARPSVLALDPYALEVPTEEIAARYGLAVEDVVRFDTNTSPFAAENLAEPLRRFADRMALNEYPDTSYGELVAAIGRYTGFGAGQVVVGCGADEILDMAAKVFVGEGRSAVVPEPTYVMYDLVTRIVGGTPRPAPRPTPFEMDADAVIAAARGAAAVWLCNPNNPTGDLTPVEDVERIVANVACPVVVDEAYYEYCGVTVAPLISKYPNLLVVRTLSKAFSLAGLRVGFGLASAGLIELMMRVRPPNSIGTIAAALGAAALDDTAVMRAHVAGVVAERTRLVATLRPMVQDVRDTETNFLLWKVADPKRVAEALLSRGLIVRDVSGRPGLAGYLRTTVRTPAENDRLLAELRRIL